ncbi:hypothetical protein AAFF_G00047170 [Aldrovandia affinis]|uniref:MADF domain-containing protein n=1 Tax=Aldrovandia affinis TaxID=143900 RepID=A0AAD7S1Q9_9TELE|nr:hypothetical protein AAFF_G00047170 [Aldrovandia affinis]
MEGKEFWSRPKIEQLCKLWKTKASLYNPDHEYRDRWQKKRDSEELAQHLGTTVGEVLKKMKNLRTQYGRERRKKCYSLNDNCQVSSSKWYLLSMLRFLEKSEASITSGADVSLEVERGTTQEWKVQVIEMVQENQRRQCGASSYKMTDGRLNQNEVSAVEDGDVPNKARNSHVKAVTGKRMRSANEERSDVVYTRGPSQEDALDIFGKFVASELRLMENPQMQKLARLHIQQVLLDVQLGTVDRTPFHHSVNIVNTSTSN